MDEARPAEAAAAPAAASATAAMHAAPPPQKKRRGGRSGRSGHAYMKERAEAAEVHGQKFCMTAPAASRARPFSRPRPRGCRASCPARLAAPCRRRADAA
eukprot:6863243-Pyramimonas_sp.AAC.2